jgi:hypothetical protein
MRFSHKAHFDRNIGCGQCHGDAAQVELATRNDLPKMAACLRCHQMPGPARGSAKGECTNCHLTSPDGTLRTSFPTGRLLPPAWLHDAAHTPDFIERHKRVAADNSSLCATCHAEHFCTDCHDGRTRPRDVHPNDWITIHPVAARSDSPRCTSCHHEQSFCLDCHARAGVARVGPSVRSTFHPAGWAGGAGGRGRGEHAWEAQRNLNACVGCHTERDCALCHASTGRRGLGVDPHPPGFASSCRTQLARNGRPCLVCHDPGSAELSRCN